MRGDMHYNKRTIHKGANHPGNPEYQGNANISTMDRVTVQHGHGNRGHRTMGADPQPVSHGGSHMTGVGRSK